MMKLLRRVQIVVSGTGGLVLANQYRDATELMQDPKTILISDIIAGENR